MRTGQKEITCCFTGHRCLPSGVILPLRSAVKDAIRHLLLQGVVYYGVGGAIGFDTLAAEALFELREEFPQLRVILVYPFAGFFSWWSIAEQERYQTLLPLYDKTVCISSTPSREAYLARNRHLVDHSACCVAYCRHSYGGTAYTLRYAQERNCKIWNLFPVR